MSRIALNKQAHRIAKIETTDIDTLGRIVVEKVRSIEGVIDTKTLTGIHF